MEEPEPELELLLLDGEYDLPPPSFEPEYELLLPKRFPLVILLDWLLLL